MSSISLLRYLYLGNTIPSYTATEKPITPVLASSLQKLNCIDQMITGDDTNLIMMTIEKAMDSNLMRRNEEALICLAYCVRILDDKELRKNVYQSLPNLLITQEDLFHFLYFYKSCSECNKGQGFGRGTRSAITKWYHKKSATELAEMIGSHRGLYNWTHKDIIKMCHIRFEDPEKQLIINSTFATCSKALKKFAKLSENELKNMEGYQRLCHIFEMKTCTDPEKAAEMITSHNLKLDFVPSHLLHHSEVWISLLPIMTYPELLKTLPILNDLRMLKPSHPVSKKFINVLSNMNAVYESKIHPIAVFADLRKYQLRHRYMEKRKKTYHLAKMKQIQMDQNSHIVTKLQAALKHSFRNVEKTGLRYFITINLRRNHFQKPVFGCKQITCLNASILIALSIVKAEDDVTVMTYTSDETVLKRVPFTKKTTYKEAVTLCNKIAQDKTWQYLTVPLDTATRLKKKIDVFITMVDSVLRSGNDGQAPINELTKYKNSIKHKFVKYIIMNMRRRKPDLKTTEKTKGILEIAGIDRYTPKVIEAFVKQQFP